MKQEKKLKQKVTEEYRKKATESLRKLNEVSPKPLINFLKKAGQIKE